MHERFASVWVNRNAPASGFIHRKILESCIMDDAASTVSTSGALFASRIRRYPRSFGACELLGVFGSSKNAGSGAE